MLPFPLSEKHHVLFKTNDANTDEGSEARPYCGFIRLYDDVVEDCVDTTPILREMDDTHFSKSDNFDKQRLHTKVNLRVVSTVSPRDVTVQQLLHNMVITDELTANLAPTEMDIIQITPLILERLCITLVTKRDDVIRGFFETIAIITFLSLHHPDTITQLVDLLPARRSTVRRSSTTPSPT